MATESLGRIVVVGTAEEGEQLVADDHHVSYTTVEGNLLAGDNCYPAEGSLAVGIGCSAGAMRYPDILYGNGGM